jgi:lysozyme
MSRLRKSGYAAALAVSLIGGFEGLRTVAYRDAVGVPTICYGETKGVHMGDTTTKALCDAKFVSRLDEFATKVEGCIKRPMSDKTEVAFTSLAYNIGPAGFCNSSVVREYNKGNYKLACNKMEAFNKAGGRVLLGLVRRRSAESALCLEGIE